MVQLWYRRHRFPAEIIQHAIWLYLRFTLSYRDVEELLAERGLDVSYETVRRWVLKFGPLIARKLRQGRPRPRAEAGRQAVTAMLQRGPAKRPERFCKPSASATKLLTAQHDLSMLPAREDQAEVVGPVIGAAHRRC
jgi:transposase